MYFVPSCSAVSNSYHSHLIILNGMANDLAPFSDTAAVTAAERHEATLSLLNDNQVCVLPCFSFLFQSRKPIFIRLRLILPLRFVFICASIIICLILFRASSFGQQVFSLNICPLLRVAHPSHTCCIIYIYTLTYAHTRTGCRFADCVFARPESPASLRALVGRSRVRAARTRQHCAALGYAI